HLEKNWAEPKPYESPLLSTLFDRNPTPHETLRLAKCANPQAEATLAAREILRFVQEGGRYREATVLVRRLDGYHHAVQQVFSRYQIPFFMDRRESISHHPMAELTLEALRTITFEWQHEDFFAV